MAPERGGVDRGGNGALRLEPGSRVGVIGSGPAGSFFAYFLLAIAQRVGLDLSVDMYEPRDFALPGPAGCNMCGGIISESLVQALAAEGIQLPPTVVERGLDSYVLHMEMANVRIETPLREKRIAAVHRGAGPRGIKELKWRSFDGYLLELAEGKGARLIRGRIDDVSSTNGRPQVQPQGGSPQPYDLLVGALGVNTGALKLFEKLGFGYRAPRTTKTYISELYLGQEQVERYLGTSMHVFLLDLPRLEFAALIPKGDYVTLCLLGHEIDRALVQAFLDAPEVKHCLPPGWQTPRDACHCSPWIAIQGASRPFADRIVMVGDAGVTRLYKDGIGAAYRTAKAAAVTAIFEGISAEHFRRHYWPVCRAIRLDNEVGKVTFAVTRQIQKRRYARQGVLRMVAREQHVEGGRRSMSMVLWDLFTGSAPYREVLLRTLHPAFLGRLLRELIGVLWPRRKINLGWEEIMDTGTLGKLYRDGETIVRQGEVGDCMYVIQEGQVEILQRKDGKDVRLGVLQKWDAFGEMALFDSGVRSATVRALGDVQVLTVDKRTFLRRVHEDPSIAFRLLHRMAQRIRELSADVVHAA
jgi:flavin-dependent dehydrogenase